MRIEQFFVAFYLTFFFYLTMTFENYMEYIFNCFLSILWMCGIYVTSSPLLCILALFNEPRVLTVYQ